ncbi:hypothetical protein VFPPC_16040 [Pochonia chlamydosporia 170]|uniref:Uncharacterized protein n=1 Tax=Pochonia chlamydosporia 170 TaxID=1380566 RepID=A0A179FLK2_METCM|nr:hypothetical protein VFPPC_16040 [Pochonia chlamydosporia 170]OAQ66515.1 hypothetical protein VFPPC_16040 [Pochonia chlamydosporia 170]
MVQSRPIAEKNWRGLARSGAVGGGWLRGPLVFDVLSGGMEGKCGQRASPAPGRTPPALTHPSFPPPTSIVPRNWSRSLVLGETKLSFHCAVPPVDLSQYHGPWAVGAWLASNIFGASLTGPALAPCRAPNQRPNADDPGKRREPSHQAQCPNTIDGANSGPTTLFSLLIHRPSSHKLNFIRPQVFSRSLELSRKGHWTCVLDCTVSGAPPLDSRHLMAQQQSRPYSSLPSKLKYAYPPGVWCSCWAPGTP